MKLTTRVRSWIGAVALLALAPVAMALPPDLNAGSDRWVADSDGAAGEQLTLLIQSCSDPDGDSWSLHWYFTPPNGSEQYLGEVFSPSLPVPDGVSRFRVVATDFTGESSEGDFFIEVRPPNTPPLANAGPDRTLNDTDGADGENVQLNGSGSSDPGGEIFNYTWYRDYGDGGSEELGTSMSPILPVRLPDGEHSIRLVVRDNYGATGYDYVTIIVNPPVQAPPTANAGPDRTVNDTNNAPGEMVVLDGSGSTDPDGQIVSYEWSRSNGEGSEILGTSQSPTLQVQLPDGENTIQLLVTDNTGHTDYDTVVITVNEPSNTEPTANAGADRTINDTDGANGEDVVLDGSASIDPDGTIINYTWYRLDGESPEQLGSSASPTLQVRLPDGEHLIRLVVGDNSENSAEDTVVITVLPPSTNGQPTANAGADRSVNDTDRAAGENVVLDGSASIDPNGTIVNYTWSRQNGESTEQLGSGSTPTLQVRLPDGENVIQLVVTDNQENSSTDTVVITVNPAASVGPTANAGDDRVIADTDREDGEDVVLDGSSSVDPDGTITNYAWSRVTGETTEALGNGGTPTLQTRLPNGENVIQLVVTDNEGNTTSDSVTITVNAVVITDLGDLPGLTPNQKQVGDALDRICADLRSRVGGEGSQLTADQQDLLARCDGLQMNNTTENQVDALDELVADDFSVARTQTLLFANTQYAGVMDRLMALRGGAKGLSLAGLNIIVDGKPVPLAQLQDMAKDLLGGGASADDPDGGGLLDDKWGLWARGNYSMGEKDRSSKSPGFDADQWSMVAGIDYRYSDKLVGGVALAHGESSIDIDGGEGGLDTDSWAASLYGSAYVSKQFYLDAIVNVANADYGADRNIVYVDGAGLVDADARGDTSGMTYSAGISGGRDFLYKGFTLAPTVGFFYIDATIDSFTERGAGGLNLIYDEQSFQSFTGNFGVRATYAYNVSWGVLLPHLRIDYVREFKNDVDVFGVRFAADPNAMSAPPILVETDNPDESYWRLATGLSAQFIHGISGYVEYQRLVSFEFISFQDVSMGLRFQKSF
jgi:uncharacterized protein YhjY with autotransporter beta-barrel domain